jgi:hypothetical protein
MKMLIVIISLLLFACAAPWQAYNCDDGYKLQASFEKDQVKWALSKKGMIMDMVPMPSVGNGLYKSERTLSSIEKKANGDVALDILIADPIRAQIACKPIK